MNISELSPAVYFRGVSKTFARHTGRLLLRDRILHLLHGNQPDRFHALRDVSFTIQQGESVAFIGHNGAGKSTLLNLVTGVCQPNSGEVTIGGRVAALLELGAGFHPDLTGTENVRINASLLGLSRQQLRDRFEEIVEFSGVRDFMDEPLRTYSSGMMMRLAFSVAVNVDPDILVIDEVLAVGDQAFASKCADRILSFRRSGKTLLCVSHSLETVEQLCDRAIWLDHGQVLKDGNASSVVSAYRETAHRIMSTAV